MLHSEASHCVLCRTAVAPPTRCQGAESAPFRSRQQEDDLCGKIIVSVVAFACGLLDNSTLLPFLRANGLDASDSFSMGEPQPKALMQVRKGAFRRGKV